MFNGKVVHYFTRWSEPGDMFSSIIKDFFETIDYHNLLPRPPGVVPFTMLDRHLNRLELTFLKYINDSKTEWCVYHSVPYGTTYW